ncbi:MAG: hypothetical protein ACU0CA_04010 [Paracoccaceae bacterium]
MAKVLALFSPWSAVRVGGDRLGLALLLCSAMTGPLYAQDGAALARAWCSGCHQFPSPQLLDRKTWIDNVLPEMGARLGFQTFRDGTYRPSTDTPPGVYAEAPLMDAAEWEQIIAWYESEAPERLVLPARAPMKRLDLFAVEMPEKPENDLPVSTAILID